MGLPDGLLARDRHLLRLGSGPFEVLSLRMQGVVGPGANLRRGAMSFSLGRVPVASRKVLPVRVHSQVYRKALTPQLLATLERIGEHVRDAR